MQSVHTYKFQAAANIEYQVHTGLKAVTMSWGHTYTLGTFGVDCSPWVRPRVGSPQRQQVLQTASGDRLCTQSFQKSLIEESASNRIGILSMV